MAMASSVSIASMSRRLSRISLVSGSRYFGNQYYAAAAGIRGVAVTANTITTPQFCCPTTTTSAAGSTSPAGATRWFATNRKVIDAKNAKRLKIQAKKKKNTGSTAKTDPNESDETATSKKEQQQPFLQHQEWVKFQQSISVDGFQTGQSLTATVLKKSRGGKAARRKREIELMRLQQQQQQVIMPGIATAEPGSPAAKAAAAAAASIGTFGQFGALASAQPTSATKFPAIRYSPEETQELLRQAYEALPERMGKRGHRNLRRQARRWKLVRDIRSQYKAHLFAAHERRMEKRHEKRQRVLQAQHNAVVQRQQDAVYQSGILKNYMKTMYGVELNDSSDEVNAVGENAAQGI